MSISLAKIEKLLEPTKDRAKSVSWFIGTVLGINDSQLVVEMKSGNAVYVQNFAYCNVGDEVLCMSNGTSIVAISTRNAQSIADGLNKVGLVYNAGEGITIDDDNRINADVTQSDITQLSTEIAGKANTTHTHSAADTTSGVFDIERIPSIPATMITGTIPADNLPGYVDDVIEGTLSTFPATGETGKIYVDTSTNKEYRWSGTKYVEISASLALGETSSTAYRGDRGKQAYDHISRSDNPHGVTYQQVGAAAEDHTHTPSEIGAAAATHNHSASNITSGYLPISRGGLGGGTATASLFNLIANSIQEFSGTDISNIYVALVDADGSSTNPILKAVTPANFAAGVATLIKPSDIGAAASSHTHGSATTSAAGFLPKLGGGTTNFLRADGTWAKPPDTNTTYSNMSGATTSAAGKAGLVPAPSAGAATRYLRSDGTWSIPPDTNTTYSAATTSAAGLMSAADKVKLNGIATGAQVNTITGIKGNAESAYRTGNVNLTPANIGAAASSHTHGVTQITGLTAGRALISNSSGNPTVSAVTSTELGYLDGVTSNVQTQLNGKAASSHTHSYKLNGNSTTNPSWYAPVSAGTAGQYLVSSGNGAPTWATIEGGVVFMPNGYPEDSVYMTYDPDFNPAETFGGTWTKETQTYLFLGITIWRCVATPNQYFSPLDMYPVGTAFLTYDKAHNPAAEIGGTWTLETQTYLFLGIKIYRRIE